MNRTRHIFRGVFILLMISLLVYLNRKTGVNLDTIARYKIETFNTIQTDSLDSKGKVDVLVKETTKLNEQIASDSSHAREVIYYLIGIVVLFILSELIFQAYARRARH